MGIKGLFRKGHRNQNANGQNSLFEDSTLEHRLTDAFGQVAAVAAASPSQRDLTESEVAAGLADGFQALSGATGSFNLAVLGDSGVGKSSLVNAIFGSDLAPTGIGRPVTQEVQGFINSAGTLRLYDFPGFEFSKGRDPVNHIKREIKKIQTGPESERIHAAWFCWDSATGRVQDEHIAAIKILNKYGIAVIPVLTKCRDNAVDARNAMALAAWISQNVPGVTPNVVFTRAGHPPLRGLDSLLEETRRVAPHAFRDALESAQILDLKAKRKVARQIISAAVAASGAAAAVPIPVLTTATLLAPIQLGMMGRIAAVFGLSMTHMLGTAGLAQLALQVTGKAAAASLATLVPVAGTVVNTSVATAWTYAAGEAWLRMCEKVSSGELDPRKVESAVDLLTGSMKVKFAELVA